MLKRVPSDFLLAYHFDDYCLKKKKKRASSRSKRFIDPRRAFILRARLEILASLETAVYSFWGTISSAETEIQQSTELIRD